MIAMIERTDRARTRVRGRRRRRVLPCRQLRGVRQALRRKLDDMQAGARVEIGEHERGPAGLRPLEGRQAGRTGLGQPVGAGSPRLAHRVLGDVAGATWASSSTSTAAATDLIFPHHENEIAQSEAFTEQRALRALLAAQRHAAARRREDEQVARQPGLDRRTAGTRRCRAVPADGAAIDLPQPARLHGRGSRGGPARRRAPRHRLARLPPGEHMPSADVAAALNDAEQRFRAAMDDDFNTPIATAVLFDLARSANRASGADRFALQGQLLRFASVLGLRLEDAPTSSGDAAPFIDLLVQLRQDLREAKQWALADGVRERLEALGVTIEDTPTGTTWRARA